MSTEAEFISNDSDLARAQTAVMALVIDDAELAWGDAVNPVLGVHDK
jgi:hypothetical protein